MISKVPYHWNMNREILSTSHNYRKHFGHGTSLQAKPRIRDSNCRFGKINPTKAGTALTDILNPHMYIEKTHNFSHLSVYFEFYSYTSGSSLSNVHGRSSHSRQSGFDRLRGWKWGCGGRMGGFHISIFQWRVSFKRTASRCRMINGRRAWDWGQIIRHAPYTALPL